jgi:hypothetical protein
MKLVPLIPYLLIVAGAMSSLIMFLSLKREIRRVVFRQKSRMEEMMARLIEAEQAPPPVVEEPAMAAVPAPLRAGLNLSNRVHALRMLRRGEDIAHIAAALGVPRREVELLVRVQSIGKARAAGAGGGE